MGLGCEVDVFNDGDIDAVDDCVVVSDIDEVIDDVFDDGVVEGFDESVDTTVDLFGAEDVDGINKVVGCGVDAAVDASVDVDVV